MKFLSLPLAAALIASTAPAAILFTENFDSSLGATTLNADIPNWTEANGTIDYIKTGSFAITCRGGVGGCIDLDGSTTDAGDLTTTQTFNLLAGVTYQVSYYFSGNQRGGAADTMTASFGGVSNTHTAIASGAAFTQFFLSVTPVANISTQLVFSHAGGDQVGLILDDVVISDNAVPEPGSMALLALGLAGLAVRRHMARR